MVKAVLKEHVGSFVNSITGDQKHQISREELIANPEKYIGLYKSYYANGESLSREIGLKNKSVSSIGKKSMLKKTPWGNIIVARKAPKKAAADKTKEAEGNKTPAKRKKKKVESAEATAKEEK